MKFIFASIFFASIIITAQQVDIKNTFIEGKFKLPNTLPALSYEDNLIYETNASQYCPVKDEIFLEHVRVNLSQKEELKINDIFSSNSKIVKESKFSKLVDASITSVQKVDKVVWIGTEHGLFIFDEVTKEIKKHESYGVNGPLSTHISDIALDSKGSLWIGTPIGLSLLKPDGIWSSIRGTEGLPVEEITSLAIDKMDRIWIGTSQGAILYKPYEENRKWFYRAGL